MLDKAFLDYRVCYSDDTLKELLETLKRPKFQHLRKAKRIARADSKGFLASEVKDFLMTIGKAIKKTLIAKPRLQEHRNRQTGRIDDLIILTIQFAVDEVEDSFEILKNIHPEQFKKSRPVESIDRSEPVRRMIRHIEDICGDSMMTVTTK